MGSPLRPQPNGAQQLPMRPKLAAVKTQLVQTLPFSNPYLRLIAVVKPSCLNPNSFSNPQSV